MEENTDQSLTPLKNERRDNPGQTKIFENSDGTNAIPTAPTWDENTPLGDIVNQYTDVGNAFNSLTENAADNVGDRQVQLIGNDFGATNPYMFNTYYEPSSTAFASEMRMQGTQAAMDEGLERAEKEAQNNLNAARQRYNAAVTAAKERENAENAKVHVSETDMSKMPENTTESEINNFIDTTEGMSDAEKEQAWISHGTSNIQQRSEKMKPEDWNVQPWRDESTNTVLSENGYTREDFKKWTKEQRDEFFGRPDVGNRWTEVYMTIYFRETYGQEAGDNMVAAFQDLKSDAKKIVSAINAKDFSTLTNEDIIAPGVTVQANTEAKNVGIDTIRNAIDKNEKISDEKKQEYNNYLNDAEAYKYITGIANGDYIKSDKYTTEGEWYYKTDYNKLHGNYTDNTVTKVPKKNAMNKYQEIIDAFGGADSFNDSLLAEYKKGGNDSVTASLDYGDVQGRLIDKADEVDLGESLSSVFGVDLESFNALAKMQKERPEDFEFINNHASFVGAGGAGAFERVEDENKKYFINGKYVSAADENSPISVGDYIFHSVDGTVQSDGKFADDDLQNFVDLYQEIQTGKKDASDENMAALNAYYNAYQNRVTRAMFLAGNYGTSVDENMYHIMLVLDGKSGDKLEFVNPADPNGEKISVDALKQWFESLSDDGKYMAYTEIQKKAHEARGTYLFYDESSQSVYKSRMKGENDIDKIGRYGEDINNENDSDMVGARQVQGLSDTDCLAIAFYLDNMMKEGKIDKGFLDNDEQEFFSSVTNSIYKNAKGSAQFWAAVGAGGIGALGSLFGIKDEEGLNDLERWAGDVWNDMSTLDESDDIFNGSGSAWLNPYTSSVRTNQRANLNHMIDTTFNLHYFDVGNKVNEKGEVVDEDGNVQNLDAGHFNHEDVTKAILVGAGDMTGAIVEFVAEAWVTAGIGKILGAAGKGAAKLTSKGISKLASKSPAVAKAAAASGKVISTTARVLTTPVTVKSIKFAAAAAKGRDYLVKHVAAQYGDDIAKGIAEGTIKSFDDVAKIAAKNAAKTIAAQEATEQAAKNIVKEGAEKAAQETAEAGAKKGAQEATESTAKNAAKAAAGSVDNVADDAAKAAASKADDAASAAERISGKTADGERYVTVLGNDGEARIITETEAKRIINNGKQAAKDIANDYALRHGLDALIDNADNTASNFGKRLYNKLERFSRTTNPFKGANSAMRELISESIADGAARAAINGRLAAATGLDVARIANLSDDAASVLYGILRASEGVKDEAAMAFMKNLSGNARRAADDVLLKNIDFKKAATKIVEMSETAATRGFKLSLDDVFRTLALDGGTKTSSLLKALKRSDFVRDRIKDWSRDIAQNYWNPELDENFKSHYVDFETYVTSPEQIMLATAFDVGSTLAGKGITRAKLFFTDRKINEIMGGVDLNTAYKADSAKFRKDMVKLDNLRLKSQKLNNKILEGKISFERIHATADKAEDAIKKHLDVINSSLDLEQQAELIINQSADAMDAAQAALAKGGRKGKREYKRILADADQLNRILVRGNDKLTAFQEVNSALQQMSITRYLDIESHAKTIHKLTGEQWGQALTKTFEKLKGINYAKKFGDPDLSEKSFNGFTINVKDKAKAKAIYRKGQEIVYNTLYGVIEKDLRSVLSTSELRELQTELMGISERMIEAGMKRIDDGGKVRWNYFPTQALTWESEPGTSSAVRALWGWDYKAGVHMSQAGEIANPSLARDEWDFFGIMNDFNEGKTTFKRRKGDATKAREEGKTGKKPDDYVEVAYNWQGFDPAYAANAYLNAMDSAKYVAPLLDPINGVVVKNPALAGSVSAMANRITNANIAKLSKKYDDIVEKKFAEKKAKKGAKQSAASMKRRAKLVEDLSTAENINTGIGRNAETSISKNERLAIEAKNRIQKYIYESPLTDSLNKLNTRYDVIGSTRDKSLSAQTVSILNNDFNELGQDIKAVRSMLTKDGKVKKRFLDENGNILSEFVDAQGNIVPVSGMSNTFKGTGATEYRTYVNKLARNKNLSSDSFSPDNAHVITFDDGTTINTLAYNKAIYDVLAVKHAIDLGADISITSLPIIENVELSADEKIELSIAKRLQPVDVDEDGARAALTTEARKMMNAAYGTYNEFSKKYKVEGKTDKIIQNAINNAYDEVEAAGGQINAYDFARVVDRHIPDFMKTGNKKNAATEALADTLELLRTYESSGGTNATLLDDLRTAYTKETDPVKKAKLADAIDTVKELDDYNNRTTGRAGLHEDDVFTRNNDDDFSGDDDDYSDQTGVERQVDENTSIDVDEMDKRLFPGASQKMEPIDIDTEAYPNVPSQKMEPVDADTDLKDFVYVELNRHTNKPRYNEKTISALVDKYQDKIAKAQTAEEIANVSDEIATDLVPLDPGSEAAATEMRHASSDIRNAIFWAKQGAPETTSRPAKPVKSGRMDFSYGKSAQPYITEKTTFEAVKSGKRTSTTRLASQHADYWQDLKVGDIVEFKNKGDTDSVLVRITKAPEWIDPTKMSDVEYEALLQKEGWTQKAFDELITNKVKAGDKALQFEYELVDKPTQPAADIKPSEKKTLKMGDLQAFNDIKKERIAEANRKFLDKYREAMDNKYGPEHRADKNPTSKKAWALYEEKVRRSSDTSLYEGADRFYKAPTREDVFARINGDYRTYADDIKKINGSKYAVPRKADVQSITASIKKASPAQKAQNLKDALDILYGDSVKVNEKTGALESVGSDFRRRADYRERRRNAYDELEGGFEEIADELEYRAYTGKSTLQKNNPELMSDFSRDTFIGQMYDIFKELEVIKRSKSKQKGLSPAEIHSRLKENNVVLPKEARDKLERYRKAWVKMKKAIKAGDKANAAKYYKQVESAYWGAINANGRTYKNGLLEYINDTINIREQKKRVAAGTGIYRGTKVLSGANDKQVLSLMNEGNPREVTWNKNYGDYYDYGTGVSSYDNHLTREEAKNALIAGRDGFGNLEFMKPEVLDEFIKKHNIKFPEGDWLRGRLENYRNNYYANKDFILDPKHRYQVQDTTTSMQESLTEYLASSNSGDKSSFAGKKSEALRYHKPDEFYNTKRGAEAQAKAAEELERSSRVSGDGAGTSVRDFTDPRNLYDWSGSGAKEVIDEETELAMYDLVFEQVLDDNNLTQAQYNKMTPDEKAKIDEKVEALMSGGAGRDQAFEKVLQQNEMSEDYYQKLGHLENRRNGESGPTKADDYLPEGEDRRGDINYTGYSRETAYAYYLDDTKRTNVSEEADKLNRVFYGDGDHNGYFDYIAELKSRVADDMADVSEKFNENITEKVTALKDLDSANDAQVVEVLENAKQQALAIENKTVRDFVVKRIDEEIKFAKQNLDLGNEAELKKKMKQSLLERDPEYRAYMAERDARSQSRPDGKVSAQVPSEANPVFVTGEFTPDGHITLQQILDSRKTVELKRSKKTGKNTLKSSKQSKEVLKSMRRDFTDGYDGTSLITSGAATQNDAWILNLYRRIHEASGLGKLPKNFSFEDIEKGSIKVKGKDGKDVTVKLPLKLNEVYVDPKIAALGAHYWGEGTATSVEWVYKRASAMSNFQKAIQDIQLAGGVGQFNALTLRNALTMLMQNPISGTAALFKNFYYARNNDSVVKFYLNNHEKLLKMAIDSGDWSAINGFTNVVNMRDEVGGRGMIQDFGKQIAEIPNVFKEKGVWKGFWDNAGNLYESIFENPTFVRWMTIAKADMNLRNYDKATSFVNRIARRYGLTEDDFKNMEGGMGSMDRYIATIAQLRSDKYWQPGKFALAGNNAEKYLDKKMKAELKRTSESLRGMPQKKTLRSCLSDFFFAIGYKLQMNAHPVDGIATIFTALPNNIRAGNLVSNRKSFNVMTSRFIGRGNRNQAYTMIGICALAHAWNTYIGAPTAWEELWGDHGDTERGTYGLPQTLLNFQDFGKFYLPNAKDQNGNPAYDPTQKGYSADPFFSIFTLQNSVARGVNRAVFPNTIPRNESKTIGTTPGSALDRAMGFADEIITANLLSGNKAIVEVISNNTYYGNNIWERRKLPDGTDNPNYNPLRNVMASVAHILNLEELWLGDRTNKWVKGLDIDTQTWRNGVQVDPYSVGPEIGERGTDTGSKTGTVAGSGFIQHEYITAVAKAHDGDYFDALTESMELPFKSRNFESKARTQLNTEVVMALRQAKKKYDRACESASPADKDKAYAEFAKTAVLIMQDWSKKNEYALGENNELTGTATKILVSFLSDEYDDVTGRIQNRYDKMRQDLKMAAGDEFLFSKEAMEAAIADGMDDTEAAEKHNAHLKALREAYIREYDARQALIEAGINPDQFDTPNYIHEDLSAIDATFDKKTYTEIMGKLKQPIGEFSDYMEMKQYYEELINNAETTKQKAKLAETYNQYVLDVISPYVGNGFSAQAFNDIYWDGDNLSNKLGKYIIVPADKKYTGKSPRANYLRDKLGIGWRDNHNLPSDKQVTEAFAKINNALKRGQISSAGALADEVLVQLRKGTIHASPEDREKLIRMRALMSSRR